VNDEQPPLTADPETIRAWFDTTIAHADGYLSVAAGFGGKLECKFFPVTDEGLTAATRYAVALDRRKPQGIYMQSTTVAEPPAKGRGGEAIAHCLTHLWADGDYGTVGHKPGLDDLPAPPTADDVAKVVSDSPLPEPSGWARSGGGYNPLWLLTEAYIIGDDEDRARVKELTTGVQTILAAQAYRYGWSWDSGVGNLDRLMKLPGTVNRKIDCPERSTGIGPGSGVLYDIAELAETVGRELPAARETMEQAEREKQERKAAREGRKIPPPRTPRQPRVHSGDGPLDVLADMSEFRDVLEPAGFTYEGIHSDGREKWLRASAGGDRPSSAYSLLCNDHVAVNWSERSDLPVGALAAGQKLTIGTLYAHLHYGGDVSEAARDIMRAAGGRGARGAAAHLAPAVLAEVKRRCLNDGDSFRAHAAGDPWDGPHDEPPRDEPPDDPPTPKAIPGLIPETFWAARPELRHIRKAAHSRNRSGDVALLAVLTRLSALVSHRIRADTGVGDLASLNLFGGIIGPSGIGKSTGVSVAGRLLVAPADLDIRDGLPIGSGEGLAEVFMGVVEEHTGEIRKGRGGTETPVTVQVRKQVRHNAFFYVDEGATLTRLMKERSGSTLGETLRSAAVGQTLGQTNASKDTSRYIPGGSYSLGLLVGFQPETVAPMLEEVAEGTPQRFVWVQVIDPSVPDEQPEWPGELKVWKTVGVLDPGDEASGAALITFDEGIRAELRAFDTAKQRGQVDLANENPYNSQAPVMKVKLAALLAILAGRRHVNPEDWRLALLLWESSCEARDAVLDYMQAKQREEQERRTLARIEEEVRVDGARQAEADRRADRTVERLALRIAAATRERGPQTRKDIRARVAGRDKKHVIDAFNYAVLREWVVEREGRFVPGPVPPP